MRTLVVAMLAVLGFSASPVSSAVSPKRVFACSFGAKQVLVTGSDANLVYRFGTKDSDEIKLVGNPVRENLRYLIDRFAHSYNQQLRFKNGEFSYVLFNRWSSAGHQGKGEENTSGLVVLRGKKEVARLKCKSGEGFSETFDLSKLPADSDDYSVF